MDYSFEGTRTDHDVARDRDPICPGRVSVTSRMPPRPRAESVQCKAEVTPSPRADHAVWALMTGTASSDQYAHAEELCVQADVGAIGGADPLAIASAGVRGGGGALPHFDAIQRSFGHHDVGGVRAHVGGDAATAAGAIGARAYATGDDVAFASSPDLHTAAHEAAHVVQQRGGVRLAGGVGAAGDPYERHADAVADLVVRGESAQSLLDTMAHRGSAGGAAVQRALVMFSSQAQAMQRLHQLLRAAPGDRDAVSAEQAEAIVQQIDRGLARTFTVMASGIALDFTVGRDEYRINVPFAQAQEIRRLAAARITADTAVAECSAEGDTATAHVTPGGVRIARVQITSPGERIFAGVAALIAGISGSPGDELEIEAHFDFPLTGMGMASFMMNMRVEHARAGEHEGEGYLVSGQFQGGIGLGIPGSARAALLAGVAVEGRGHDPDSCTSMLGLSLDHAIGTLCQPLADAMFGRTYAAHAMAAMREGDYADSAGMVGADVRAEGHGPAHGSGIEVAAGLSDHWRASGEHGETEQSYVDFDMHIQATLAHPIAVQVGFDVHVAAGHGDHPPDQLKARFRLGAHAAGGALAAGLVAEILQQLEGALAPPQAAPARRSTRAAMREINTLSSGAQDLVTQGLLQSAAHGMGEVGIEFELDIVERAWHVRIVEEAGMDFEAGEGRYEHLTDITPPTGGGAHEGHEAH